ncbi:MAG: IS200/IS605 family transposase, partial [Muribaculaceae bacterium]
MSKTKSLHHIVFATKHRKPTIAEEHKRELYAYIFGILKNKKCFLLRMNGIADHIHMLIDIHPTVAIADLVKDLKQNSNRWMKENPKFSRFESWGEGYYAVSINASSGYRIKNVILPKR